MRKQYDFSKAKAKAGSDGKKVQISMRIDADLLVWAQDKADKMGIGYQTLLNMKLREAMSENQDDHIREIVREELRKRA